jgi:hypothetical protein
MGLGKFLMQILELLAHKLVGSYPHPSLFNHGFYFYLEMECAKLCSPLSNRTRLHRISLSRNSSKSCSIARDLVAFTNHLPPISDLSLDHIGTKYKRIGIISYSLGR